MGHDISPGGVRFSRSRLLKLSALATVAALRGFDVPVPAHAASPIDNAISFLNRMMDLYASGQTLRLAQSYVPTAALNLGPAAYTYDNAVLILTLLGAGYMERATVLGNALLYAQAHDPQWPDGRLRASYSADPYVNSYGAVAPLSPASTTGVMAWAGLALTFLSIATSNRAYLDGAVRAGAWIIGNAADPRGAGGFAGGLRADNSPITYKSTEHNIDCVAFFRLLASVTGNAAYNRAAASAQSLISSMWNPAGGYFWTGTGYDGITTNTSAVSEDVQSWSYLVLHDRTYASALDWASHNLSATDGIFSGVSFDTSDRTGVWFEGTAHMAAALRARGDPGDESTASRYLDTVRAAQMRAVNADGSGIPAASHDGLRTVDGDKYFAALHVGATAWYCLAELGVRW